MIIEIRRITLVRFNIKKWLECLPLFIVPPFPIDSITFYESHGRIEHRKAGAPSGYGGAPATYLVLKPVFSWFTWGWSAAFSPLARRFAISSIKMSTSFGVTIKLWPSGASTS